MSFWNFALIALIQWIVQQDFLENAVPLFKHHLKEKGACVFFSYIQEHKAFYRCLFAYDDGTLLTHSLLSAYFRGTELSKNFSMPATQPQPLINTEVYRRYSASGIAAVVRYWIETDMDIPVEKMGRDLYLMMESPLGFVRDNCL